MSKVTIEMEHEQIDKIIVQGIKSALEYFEEYLVARSEGVGLAIFDSDPVKDVWHIEQHIAAFEVVLEYYGGDDFD